MPSHPKSGHCKITNYKQLFHCFLSRSHKQSTKISPVKLSLKTYHFHHNFSHDFLFQPKHSQRNQKIVIQYFDLTSYSRTMKKHSQEKFKYSLYKDQYLCAFYLKLLLIIKFIQTRIFSFGVSCLKSGAKVIQLKSKWYYYSFILQIQGHSIKSNLFFDLRYDRKNILKSVLASVPPNIPTYTKITVKNFEKSIYFQLFCDFFVSTKSKEKAFRTLHLSQNFLRCSKIVQKRKNYCTIF
eukprot:TRINITY_DN10952_c1_g1_i1.p1 TRINITY_DN10952_c1_g1~~TRINITY_DN10952_c1_g1_i1.p1  ORF type:complete len:239 (+),score=-12.76 TRINITY_DN10952_c1_g1_i1:64-780(+)